MFLPRDDMLARYTLSSCVRLSVCPPVRLSQAGIYRNDWTNRADFDKDASFNLSRTVRKFGYFQKLRTSGTLSQSLSIALSTKLVAVVVDGRVC